MAQDAVAAAGMQTARHRPRHFAAFRYISSHLSNKCSWESAVPIRTFPLVAARAVGAPIGGGLMGKLISAGLLCGAAALIALTGDLFGERDARAVVCGAADGWIGAAHDSPTPPHCLPAEWGPA
ncbi:MAG: hypothetical protein R3F55_25720 [Alphaproteobacteria bacterium]